MADSVRVPDLAEVPTLADSDTVVVNVSAGTRIIKKSNLLKEVGEALEGKAPQSSVTELSTTVNGHTTEINNLKNSVGNGKTLVASAITGKDPSATVTGLSTFAELAAAVEAIPTSGGGGSAEIIYSNTWTYAAGQQTITVPANSKALLFVSGKSLYGASNAFVTVTTTAGTVTNLVQKNIAFSGATGSTNSIFLLEGMTNGASVTVKFPTVQNAPVSYDAFISVVKLA